VPAAIAIRIILEQGPPTFVELRGPYTTTVSGARPASLNGRWTITFSPYAVQRGPTGLHTLTHNRKPAARGGYTVRYHPDLGQYVILRDLSEPEQCVENIVGGFYTVRVDHSKLTLQASGSGDPCLKRRAVINRTFERGR
jgi:hypothetical protein